MHDVSHVSTQVFNFEGGKLALDYFDAAGALKFYGDRNRDHLVFDWSSGELWKKSEFWKERKGSVRFKYESRERDPQTHKFVTLNFESLWTKDQSDGPRTVSPNSRI